jgi:hypothetical protein
LQAPPWHVAGQLYFTYKDTLLGLGVGGNDSEAYPVTGSINGDKISGSAIKVLAHKNLNWIFKKTTVTCNDWP